MSATKALLSLYIEAETATEAEVLAGTEGKLVTADVIAPLLGVAVPNEVVEAAVEQYFIDNPASGDVTGPSSSTNDRIAVFSGTSGKVIKQGPVLGDGALLDIGTGANTLAAGDDARITGALQADQNLADLDDAGQARDNLGLDEGGIQTVAARFPTRGDAAAATISGSVNAIQTLGYTTAGDGGGAIYRRVVSQPSHKGKVQTADGAWWEMATASVTPAHFGWVPGGDVGPALRAAYAFCAATKCKVIELATDPADTDGYYSIWSADDGVDTGNATNNRCVLLSGSTFNNIKLIGQGRSITRLKYRHAQGLVSRSIISATGCDLHLQGLSFDGAEQDRITPGSGAMVLTSDVTSSATSITITSGSTYLPSADGQIKLDNEWIAFASRSANVLSGCVRGIRGTTAAAHTAGAVVTYRISSGHHPLGIAEFQRVVLRDVGILNSPSYGIGIENTGTQEMKGLEIDGLYTENTASDGIDVKCPVANGNRLCRVQNVWVKGWSRENGWTTTQDIGLDFRIPGVNVVNVDFEYTEYMGNANGLSVRQNQVTDFSGGHFAKWTNVNFHGYAGPHGTKVPVHNGISDDTDAGALFVNVTARNLTGNLGALRRSRLTNFRANACGGGIAFSGSGARLHNGRIENCGTLGVGSGIGVTATTGALDCLAENVIVTGGGSGFTASGGGKMTLRNCSATGNTTDYQVTGCTVEKTPGQFTTVTADYTATNEDDTIYVDSTAGNVTVNLPHATQVAPGRQFTIIKTVAANSVIVDPFSTQKINGALTQTITSQYATVRARSNGTEWFST